jgi:predicted membrane channel-forming protein YqfA (hemolysin III family)
MNIWSHLIGFVCIVIAGIQISAEFFSESDSFYQIMALETYILCASVCLLLSSIYHWFGCLSEDHHDNLLKLDLTGVALLIAGSYFAAVYYGSYFSLASFTPFLIMQSFTAGFYCTPSDQVIHLCLTGLVLVIGLSAPWVHFEIGGVSGEFFFAVLLLGLFLLALFH